MELQNCMTDMLSTLASGFGDKALMLVDKDGTPAGHILGTEMVGAMEYEREKSGMRLPAGYQELAYIENSSSDAVYINTGLIPTSETDVSVDMQLIEIPSSEDRYVFGRYSSDFQFFLYLRLQLNCYQWGWSSAYKNSTNTTLDTYRHVIRLYSSNETSYLNVDGVDKSSQTTSTQTGDTLPFTLFRGGGRTPALIFAHYRVFGCVIKQAGVVAMHLVPAKRNSDNVVGMYDLVSNTFLTNAGTGTFSYGEL